MRVVIQRVLEASVIINSKVHAAISRGYVILVGIETGDVTEDADWLCNKIAQLRVFPDHEGQMNRSIEDIGGEALIVSQFTLHASYKKGNRPSFIRAARPEVAIKLYHHFMQKLSNLVTGKVVSGVFGADMKVVLANDGPVTIIMDTHNKE